MDDEQDTERRRSRRAKSNVNYSKDQDFSDEDIFEDSPIEDTTPKRGRPKASRKSTGTRRKPTPADVDEDGMADDEEIRSNKPVFTEKGYDPNLPPIRERFPFMPEVELDGSPRIDLIVGRRPVDDNGDEAKGSDDVIDSDDSGDGGGPRSRRRGGEKKKDDESPTKEKVGVVEYEYLIKHKNRSYLHLEWKSGADLESMNKSAKTIYRRYLKKIAQGLDDDLESPEFDPSFIVPQKIIAEKEQEMTLELTDKELIKWEKQREKELAEDSDNDSNDDPSDKKNEDDVHTNKGESSENLKAVDSAEKKGEILISVHVSSSPELWPLTLHSLMFLYRRRSMGR